MNLKLEVATRCKEIREESRISVNDWANYLALKPEHIRDFERGTLIIPTLVLMEYVKLKQKKIKVKGNTYDK